MEQGPCRKKGNTTNGHWKRNAFLKLNMISDNLNEALDLTLSKIWLHPVKTDTLTEHKDHKTY